MTTICAAVTPGGRGYLASDAQVTLNLERVHAAQGLKAWRAGDGLFGVSGPLAFLDVARSILTGSPAGGEDFMSLLRREAGEVYAKARAKGIEAGHFLAVGHGRIFRVTQDGGVFEYRGHFAAIGSGADYAIGAAHVYTREHGLLFLGPNLSLVIEAAATYDLGTSGPLTLLELPIWQRSD